MGLFSSLFQANKYKTKDKKISFRAEGYQKIKDKSDYDLRLKNEKSYIGVFSYDINDFGEATSKIEVAYRTIDDLMSRRTEVKVEVPMKKIEDNAHTIYQVVYTAKRDGTKNVYCFSIVEFDQNTDLFAVVIFTSLAPYKEEVLYEHTEILKTAELLGY